MGAIDGWLEGILQGPNASLEIVLLISFLLGLRHASDPEVEVSREYSRRIFLKTAAGLRSLPGLPRGPLARGGFAKEPGLTGRAMRSH